jgi:trk system potassium uptake protein TrkH
MIRIHPIWIILGAFTGAICAGSLLLIIPVMHSGDLSFIDALFTSTSAVCVTGLTVVTTGEAFTVPGQIIILILIQMGGLGIMTFSIGILSMTGLPISIRWSFLFRDMYTQGSGIGSSFVLLRRVLLYTFVIESITAVMLLLGFISHGASIRTALWPSIFHAVSAFCNAGFSLYGESLVRFTRSPGILSVVSIAIILGGLGFVVLAEGVSFLKKQKQPSSRRLSMHTRIVIITTIVLLAAGAILFLAIEWNGALAGLTVVDKVSNAFFQSVTCRTAGFTTIPLDRFHDSSIFAMIILMFIGGSPGSMAGGIKTTTFALIFGIILSSFQGRKQIIFKGQAIASSSTWRGTSLTILSIAFVAFSFFLLLVLLPGSGQETFLHNLFETVSAFGTVGLSLGTTDQLGTVGKILVILVMFTGRTGPLILMAALAGKLRRNEGYYAEENIMIG